MAEAYSCVCVCAHLVSYEHSVCKAPKVVMYECSVVQRCLGGEGEHTL